MGQGEKTFRHADLKGGFHECSRHLWGGDKKEGKGMAMAGTGRGEWCHAGEKRSLIRYSEKLVGFLVGVAMGKKWCRGEKRERHWE